MPVLAAVSVAVLIGLVLGPAVGYVLLRGCDLANSSVEPHMGPLYTATARRQVSLGDGA